MEKTQEQEEAENRINFTKESIEALKPTEGKQLVYYDSQLRGLGIRVGTTKKAFFVYGRVKGGRPVRVTLGKFPLMTVKAAKEAAKNELARLSAGEDELYKKRLEKEKKKKLEAKAIANAEARAKGKSIAFEDVYTVRDVFDYYIQEQLIHNKGNQRITQKDENGNEIVVRQSSTLKDADLMVKYFDQRTITTLKKAGNKWVEDEVVEFPSLLDIPFRDITAKTVVQRFDYLSRARPTRTNKEKPLEPIKRTHQLVFKYALSAFSFTINRLRFDLTDSGKSEALINPFEVLSATKKWKKAEIRERFIDFNKPECAAWWNAVLHHTKANGVVSDYIFFSLIQVGRSIDIASLTWDKVNFSEKTITYNDTKNSKTYIFPLTRFALEILERRKKENTGKDFVFEYPASKTGYVPQDCKDHFKTIGVASGVLVSHHDLRRTWLTLARLVRIENSHHAVIMDERNLDYCLKHSRNDVNEHYFMGKKNEITATLQIMEDAFISKVAKFSAPEQSAKLEKQEENTEHA